MKISTRYYKNLIKEKSSNLRTTKNSIKERQRNGDYAGQSQANLRFDKSEMRYIYLAYGLSRGKTLEQIENKTIRPVDMDHLLKQIEKHNEKIKTLELEETPKEIA